MKQIWLKFNELSTKGLVRGLKFLRSKSLHRFIVAGLTGFMVILAAAWIAFGVVIKVLLTTKN